MKWGWVHVPYTYARTATGRHCRPPDTVNVNVVESNNNDPGASTCNNTEAHTVGRARLDRQGKGGRERQGGQCACHCVCPSIRPTSWWLVSDHPSCP